MPNLIALGGADGVWDELEQALALCPTADIGAVNEAGRDYPGHLSLWATLHPEKFATWQRGRERKGLNTDYVAVSHKGRANTRVDHLIGEAWSGTSGLYLCQVAAINFGYDRIICCGMPLAEGPHYWDEDKWWAAPNYKRGWKEAVDQQELRGKIKSMSGWTGELVGKPTKEWLAVPAND